MRVLADELGLTPPATTALIDRLEERDLARRERDPVDRRVIRVVLGPAARTFGEQHLRPLAERLEAAATALDDAEAAAVARFLAAVVGDASPEGARPAPLPSPS
jgi:DNA-binding MarR family transcriptional regulator